MFLLIDFYFSQLRKLLSRECDLIYECKVCRNIFRSLTNFISHKRVYCRSSFSASDHFHFRDNGFQVQDISTIIQAEQEINNNPNGAAGILPGTDDKSKDLSGIVERLLWKQHQSRTSNLNDFYDQIHTSKKTDDSSSHKSHTLKLNRVNDSDIAVYQSLQVDNENSNMKDEVSEVHKMLSKSNTVLGPDGKILNLFNSAMERNGSPAPSAEDLDNVPLTCQVCNLQFETEKTLKLHLELKHLPSTYVYQCPSCPQKFSSSAAVIKHLSNDHK
jgi:Zinc finger, C2H2 type/Zinc-finger of C2H2 type